MASSELHILFPSLVQETKIPEQDNDQLEKIIQQKSIESTDTWRCNTKTTFDTCNVIDDPEFQYLIKTITNKVHEFSKQYGAYGKVSIVDAWINVAEQGAYQEYHIHPNSHFSAVYYIKTPTNCGNLVLRSHEADFDMFMLPLNEYKPASYKTWAFVPDKGKLVIFRSNMKHMVEKNESEEIRISFAANFVIH